MIKEIVSGGQTGTDQAGLLVAAEQNSVIDDVQQWVREHHIEKLNIAGPRESNSPGIYEQSCGLFRELFPALKSYPKMSC